MKKLATHNGRFHADEVFATAVLSLVFDNNIQITRTRDEQIINKADIVYDVGHIYNPKKLKFDHHQKDFGEKRENGIPYSSVGLVWKEFGEKLTNNNQVAQRIDKTLIQAIDAEDNGIDFFENHELKYTPYTIQNAISSFRPTYKEQDSKVEDERFMSAVNFAKTLLLNEIKKTTDTLKGEHLAKEIIENQKNNPYIIIDKKLPWGDVIIDYKTPLFVIEYSKQNDQWSVYGIRKSTKSLFSIRKEFPKNWGGKEKQELVQITGVKDAVFCHKGLFLAVAKSKAGATKLAELAINN